MSYGPYGYVPPPFWFPPMQGEGNKGLSGLKLHKFLKRMEKEWVKEQEEEAKKKKDKEKDKKPPTFTFLQLVGVLTLFGPPLAIGYIIAVNTMLKMAADLVLTK